MKYSIGLDCGITSIGWCVLNLDKKRIEDIGVRKFNKAENPKTGSSLAEPRRMARSARRIIRRKALRIKDIKKKLFETKAIDKEGYDSLFHGKKEFISPWILRARGLTEKLSPEEWTRVLIHLAKRRGFKSNRKIVPSEEKKNEEKLLAGVSRTSQLRKEKNYITIGQMFAEDESFQGTKRNRIGNIQKANYTNTISRSEIQNEIIELFKHQRQLGNEFADEKIEKDYLSIWGRQKSYSDPKRLNEMIGQCTFEKNEKRAPQNCYSTERSMLLQKINNLQVGKGWLKNRLNKEQRKAILDLAYEYSKVTFSQIRKKLKISEDMKFNSVTYKRDQDISTSEKKTFVELKFYQSVKKAIEAKLGLEKWNSISGNINLLDDLGYALTIYKEDPEIKEYLRKKGIEDEIIDAVISLSFSKFGHLSIKALSKIIPYLENGDLYNESVKKAGYSFSRKMGNGNNSELPYLKYDDVRNPSVFRACTEGIKELNAIYMKYGPPHSINIELSRDMYKSLQERREIEREQEKNRAEIERSKLSLKEEYGFDPKREAIQKNRHWHEQLSICPYSRKAIDRRRLLEDGYCEIDHILPYSRSFDDSFSNKVLVLKIENDKKGNRTPYEYLGQNSNKWEQFKTWIDSNFKNFSEVKISKILTETFDDNKAFALRDRCINDTRYICRLLKDHIEDNLQFSPDPSIKQRVFTLNGRITATLRRLWGLYKNREENSLHHALDAAVIAAASRSCIMGLENYFKMKETRYMNSKKALEDQKRFSQPWENFRKEIIARLSMDPKSELAEIDLKTYDEDFLSKIHRIIPSYVVNRKRRKGKIHEDTIRSCKLMTSEKKTYVKIHLSQIKEDAIKKMLDNLQNMKKSKSQLFLSDVLLYDAIIDHLKNAIAKGIKYPFENGFKKPTRKIGHEGPNVYSIKVLSSDGISGIPMRGGVAENLNIARIDIFKIKEKTKFFIIPIYIRDYLKDTPPNRAITTGKPESEWEEIDDSSYEFVCSLYPNDLIKIKFKDGKTLLGFYKECNRNTGNITLNTLENNKETKKGVSLKTKAESITKYYVDLLGKLYAIKEKKRKWDSGKSLLKIQQS